MIPVTQIKTLTKEGKLQEIVYVKLIIFVFVQQSLGGQFILLYFHDSSRIFSVFFINSHEKLLLTNLKEDYISLPSSCIGETSNYSLTSFNKGQTPSSQHQQTSELTKRYLLSLLKPYKTFLNPLQENRGNTNFSNESLPSLRERGDEKEVLGLVFSSIPGSRLVCRPLKIPEMRLPTLHQDYTELFDLCPIKTKVWP